jgi:A/G-specific adenine glycosylase
MKRARPSDNISQKKYKSQENVHHRRKKRKLENVVEVDDTVEDIEDCEAPALAVLRHKDDYHFFTSDEIDVFQDKILEWYDANQRVLPWRKPSAIYAENNPHVMEGWESKKFDHGYGVLLSEIMLQQTQVNTVIDYFNNWMETFPTLEVLANASEETVRASWAGLGYYRRSKFLHECAKEIVNNLNGAIPQTAKELSKLPGIGKYTAGAISSIVFNQKEPIVDGNVVRVLTRMRAISAVPNATNITKLLWNISGDIVHAKRPGDFNQSLMELGATVCTKSNPDCMRCPVNSICHALKESKSKKIIEQDKCQYCTFYGPTKTVTKYPIQKQKKEKKELKTIVTILVNESGGESYYLIIQRPKKGLLASFWEFPSVDLESDDKITKNFHSKKMKKYLKTKSITWEDTDIQKSKEIGSTSHIYTHIKQEYTIQYLRLDNIEMKETKGVTWAKKESLSEFAISKGMKKCLEQCDKNVNKKTVQKKLKW